MKGMYSFARSLNQLFVILQAAYYFFKCPPDQAPTIVAQTCIQLDNVPDTSFLRGIAMSKTAPCGHGSERQPAHTEP